MEWIFAPLAEPHTCRIVVRPNIEIQLILTAGVQLNDREFGDKQS